MKVKKNFSLRNIAGNYIVVAVGADVVNFNGMISLNETGAFLWKALETERTKEDLVKMLASEYEGVDMETLAADVNDFILSLEKVNVIEE